MSIVGISDAVQAALYTLLSGDPTLAALVVGVYEEVPEGSAYPYVQLGEFTETKDAVFERDGRMVLATLHVWSQYAGQQECWTIAGRIGDLIDETTPTVSGATVESCEVEQAQVLRDPDGRTRHGVIQLRISLAA
jgi:hypothetical protein